MRKSYEEAQRVLGVLDHAQTPVLEGATAWLTDSEVPEPSPATKDLIERARSGESRPLYVVAIGAPTNISHALLLAPEIIDHIVVVWLGGNALNWPTASEFNLKQDPTASRVLLDSGVALVHVPCLNVADHLTTTRDEVEHYVRPAGRVGALLAERFEEYVEDRPGISKVIWDLGGHSLVAGRVVDYIGCNPQPGPDRGLDVVTGRPPAPDLRGHPCPPGRNIRGLVQPAGPARGEQSGPPRSRSGPVTAAAP